MFGYCYPYAMMGMMAPTMMGSMFSANAPMYFKSKYGCEDCFRKDAYPRELPIPYTPRSPEITGNKEAFKKLMIDIFA